MQNHKSIIKTVVETVPTEFTCKNGRITDIQYVPAYWDLTKATYPASGIIHSFGRTLLLEMGHEPVAFDPKQTLAAQLTKISRATKTSWTPDTLVNIFAFMFMAFPHQKQVRAIHVETCHRPMPK